MGTLGFCLIFNVTGKHIIFPTIGGGICWGAFLLLRYAGLSVFAATFFSAALIGVCGEIISIIYKMPTTVFIIPACVPLIPGSNLYYALSALISKDWEQLESNTEYLGIYALGIAVGLAAVFEISHIVRSVRSACKTEKAQ